MSSQQKLFAVSSQFEGECMETVRAVATVPVQTGALARLLSPLAALAFGLILLYGVGFSSIPAAHNTTHDARHAAGFPCH
jgi:cobalt transporter subunit CbtB